MTSGCRRLRICRRQLIDHLCKVWDQPDDGIWETRGGRKHLRALEGDGLGWAGPGDQAPR